MTEPDTVTGYADVDDVLHWFLARARVLLGDEFVGMYLVGSLALGDFDPAASDIDSVVVTEARLVPDVIDALRDMYALFDRSESPWSGRAVTSKPAAAHWALQSLGQQWSALITRVIAGPHGAGRIEPWEEQQTLALIEYTVDCFRKRLSPSE